VIFTLDEPLRIAQHVDPAQPPGAYETLVGGLHTSPAVIEHYGSQSGIQLQLSPLGARALFGVPAGVLAGIDVCGTDLLGARASAVRDQLCEAASWPGRFQILDHELGRQLAESRRPPAEVCRAWRMLRVSSGTVSIAQVAREVGWSDRQLTRGFRREIGLTPRPRPGLSDSIGPAGSSRAAAARWSRRNVVMPIRPTSSASSFRLPA
jgi:AraC-like DNA-binding protein